MRGTGESAKRKSSKSAKQERDRSFDPTPYTLHPEPRPPPRSVPTTTAIATIKNRLGLHARPAMAFVDLACTFTSDITVRRTDNAPGDPVDGKSIMMMMMLAATQGTELEVSASGEDSDKAAAALKALIDAGFDEE